MHHDLDQLYIDWMAAEAHEQAALVLLGASDTIEIRVAAEIASERREAAESDYRAALESARDSSSSITTAVNSR
jgi:hypothetical protein